MYTWKDHERRILGKLGLSFTRKQLVLDVGCGGGARKREEG
jgi:2-polyprenyl-3-methyl-5-hydroxy-6-metoxy-1,4-benzoquinol methylase